jgi:ribosomal protein L12E/L44/L45/RPP1/RPP2
MKSEEELKQQAKEIRMLELRKESGEMIDRAIGKSEGFFLLLIVLTIGLSNVIAQGIIKGFDLLGILILIFGLIIEVRTIKEVMSYESALVEGAKLAIFVGKRLDETEREEAIKKAKDAEKKAAPKTRKPRTKKSEAKADEKPGDKASTK